MGKTIRINILNRQLLHGQIECSAGDGEFKNGENLVLCPNCKSWCHLDCLLAYGNNCPRCLYNFVYYNSTIHSEITSDDKLLVFLAYVFSPFVPPILMIIADKKSRPFIKAHNAQAFIVGLIGIVLSFFCVGYLVWLYQIYLGFQAWQGRYIEIPLITTFCKDLGWA